MSFFRCTYCDADIEWEGVCNDCTTGPKVKLYDEAIKDVLAYMAGPWNLGKDNPDSYTLAFLMAAIERGEAKGASNE